MFNNEIKKKEHKKPPKSTDQTHDPGYKTEIPHNMLTEINYEA